MLKGIEGARAWLAWLVVAGHIVRHSPFYGVVGLRALPPLSILAVKVFLTISGFVIARLVVVKHEPYGRYLTRRALRIFPAYLVGLAAGVALAGPAMALLTVPMEPGVISGLVEQQHQIAVNGALHLALHLTLFHGLVPDSLLPFTSYEFLPPAWSLSLEWQFYLVAPFAIAAGLRWPRVATTVTAVSALLFISGLFGRYDNVSSLLGGGVYFMIGIATFAAFDRLPRFRRFPVEIVIGLAPIAAIAPQVLPLLGWIALISYVRTDRPSPLLDSRLAVYLGERSYGVYILHYPVLIASALLSWKWLALPAREAAALTAVLTVLLTLLVSGMIYRMIEQPAIQRGKRLGRAVTDQGAT